MVLCYASLTKLLFHLLSPLMLKLAFRKQNQLFFFHSSIHSLLSLYLFFSIYQIFLQDSQPDKLSSPTGPSMDGLDAPCPTSMPPKVRRPPKDQSSRQCALTTRYNGVMEIRTMNTNLFPFFFLKLAMMKICV